jgi:outer membrane protein TolC
VRDLSDQIKRAMNDPDFPITSAVVIVPADQPTEYPIVFNLQDQINTAMENRAELGQQQLRVDSATLVVKVAKNNLLPQLNFVGSLGVQGVGTDIPNAIDSQADLGNIGYRLGLQLEIPLGNREARAIYQRTLLQRQQAIDQYRSLIEQVSLEDAGDPLTQEFIQLKLQSQADLANAQSAEAEAIANYNLSIANLERAKGTLLRYNNVTMEEAPGVSVNPTAAR